MFYIHPSSRKKNYMFRLIASTESSRFFAIDKIINLKRQKILWHSQLSPSSESLVMEQQEMWEEREPEWEIKGMSEREQIQRREGKRSGSSVSDVQTKWTSDADDRRWSCAQRKAGSWWTGTDKDAGSGEGERLALLWTPQPPPLRPTFAVAVALLVASAADAAAQRDQPVSICAAVQFGGLSLLCVFHAWASHLHEGIHVRNRVWERCEVPHSRWAALVEHLMWKGTISRQRLNQPRGQFSHSFKTTNKWSEC